MALQKQFKFKSTINTAISRDNLVFPKKESDSGLEFHAKDKTFKPHITKREFDSDEEKYFSWYLDELLQAKYISRWVFQPYTYRLSRIEKYSVATQLKNKVGTKRLSLFRAHEYTPDFGVEFTPKSRRLFYNLIGDGIDLRTAPFIANYEHDTPYGIVEIKPSFDRNNMIRLFRINQKWMFFQNKLYVQEVVVDKKNGRGLFADTFTPIKYLKTPTGKDRTLKFKPKTLKEFVDTHFSTKEQSRFYSKEF
jgi:hypothetical protein